MGNPSTDTRHLAPSAAQPAAGSVAWLLDASERNGLALVRGSDVVDQGKLALVSLSAIEARLGSRWEQRCDAVHGHAERTFRRHIGHDAFIMRLSDTAYLIGQPQMSPLGGQIACFDALREVLSYFLGEAIISDVIVHQVTAITDVAIEGHQLNVLEQERLAAEERAHVAARPSAPRPQVSQWTPFVASDGRRVRVSCALEPLVHLASFKAIGHRVRRRVLPVDSDQALSAIEQGRLSTADIEKVDMATLERGLGRLDSDVGPAKQPSLVLPVSYASLTSSRARPLITEAFIRARERVQTGLICEVCDLEGVPAPMLVSALSLIRPFCLFLVGRLNEPPKRSLAEWRGVGFQGFSFEWSSEAASEAGFAAEVYALAGACRPAAKNLLLYRLPSARHAAIAAQLGVTHATMT